MAANVLKGHGLFAEGRVLAGYGWGSGPGRGKCSCGALSETLPSTAARQRWHKEHKAEVRAAQVRAVLEGKAL